MMTPILRRYLKLVFLLIAYGLNEDVPEYDMDNEDEKWLEGFNKKKVRNPIDAESNRHLFLFLFFFD